MRTREQIEKNTAARTEHLILEVLLDIREQNEKATYSYIEKGLITLLQETSD